MSIYITKDGEKRKVNISATDVQLLDIDGKFKNKNLEDVMSEVGSKINKVITESESASWNDLEGKPPIQLSTGTNSIVLNDLDGNTAKGTYAFAEGYKSTASGDYSHAEGYLTTASVANSHAEGDQTIASGTASHAEGCTTTASGNRSHAEGYSTIASGAYSHAEGYMCTAHGKASHVEGYRKTSGKNVAYGVASHVEGYDCVAGSSSLTTDTTCAAHAEGYSTIASGAYSHAEGNYTIAEGEGAHTEGYYTKAIGKYSHAEGYNTMASSLYSHAQGYYCKANAHSTHAGGYYTIANGYSQTAIGRYNVGQGTSSSFWATDNAFILGNGTAESARSNAFRITWEGAVYSKGAYNTSGADYAEMFEWSDGNINNEERLGYFVTFDNKTEQIRKATSKDDYILGIVSHGMAVLGDNYDEEWKDKYLRDKWGRIQYEIISKSEEKDENGDIITPAHTEEIPILNPDYNSSTEYISRKHRKEWNAIGLLGKLLVYDDGSCEVGGYCMPNDEGIATKSEQGYRVLAKDKKNGLVKVLFR